MLTITKQCESDYRVKGSKFLSYLIPCDSAEEADKQLKEIKDLHPTATHHCYAYRVDPSDVSEFSQDDGEPGGTAGLPILNVLRSAEIVNSIAIVVRYYGGTKLGKSGLIDAYGKATEMAKNRAELKTILPTIRFTITYPYNQQSLIDKLTHTYALFEKDATYAEDVQLVVECSDSDVKRFEKHLNRIDHLLIYVKKGSPGYHINS